jgi:hypothetical protein
MAPIEIAILASFYGFLVAGALIIVRRIREPRFNESIALRDGGIFYGKIIEQMPDIFIKIETKEFGIMVFTIENIVKINNKCFRSI